MGDVLGYARVSTGDQDVAGQTMRLEQAGAIRVFTDVRSGKSMNRPGLVELLAYARQGDILAVVRLDRLGRSLAELISIVDQLKTRGIGLVSLEEKIDTSSAAGELIFHVFGAIAHFERRLISERTKDGIVAARERGRHAGRRPVDPDKVRAALALVGAGLSPTQAASQLGLGRSTVYREIAAAGGAREAGARISRVARPSSRGEPSLESSTALTVCEAPLAYGDGKDERTLGNAAWQRGSQPSAQRRPPNDSHLILCSGGNHFRDRPRREHSSIRRRLLRPARDASPSPTSHGGCVHPRRQGGPAPPW